MVVRIAVAGGLGRMGSEIVLSALSRPDEFAVGAAGVEEGDARAGKRLADVLPVKTEAVVLAEKGLKEGLRGGKWDVLVDVTGPEAAVGFMRSALDARVPFVSGSTGIKQKALDDLATVAAKAGVAGVWTPNFSVGVNVWWALLEKAAKALPGYEVEVVEIHHNQKRDAPSGTAARAVDVLKKAGAGPNVVYGRTGLVGTRGREIGVHAVRLGDVVGEHTAYFGGNAERIEVTHRAHSRLAFAAGALAAVRWVAAEKRGGLYSMADVLGIA